MTDESKLAPGLRNPFLPSKEQKVEDFLFGEKLAMGVKLIKEKFKAGEGENESEDSAEEMRNGNFLFFKL